MKIYIKSTQSLDNYISWRDLREIAKSTSDSDLLTYLSKHPNPKIRLAVYQNLYTSDEIRNRMMRNEKDPGILEYLESSGIQDARAIARNPNTSTEVLLKLSHSPDASVRWEVAGNPNVPIERLYVGKNKNTPPQILAKLANDEAKAVRMYVANNPNTSPEVLTKLIEDSDATVRSWTISNKSTPPEALARYSERVTDGSNVLRNPNTPPEIVARFMNDKSYEIRMKVAKHQNASQEVLAKLAKDRSRQVREAAIHNPNYRG